jgi:uncharacterized membrane protein
MESFRSAIELAGTVIDATGVLVIALGALVASFQFVMQRKWSAYQTYRQSLGRAILLGLEFLVAGDIIRTVVVAPTRENVMVLGLIVLIRTFLSTSMLLELEGRWPWQKDTDSKN